MANYFKNFPVIGYQFGDSSEVAMFHKLSSYADLIDRVQDNITTYSYYEIQDFDRPDSLSYKLYGTTEYYWTFFLMNDNLREQGWPMTSQDLYEFSDVAYPYWAADFIVTNLDTLDSAVSLVSTVSQLYPAGTEIKIVDSLAAEIDGTIISKNLETGELIVNAPNATLDKNYDFIKYADGSNEIKITDLVKQKNGTHHFIDTDENIIGVCDFGTKIPITNEENLINVNNSLKQIKVIKQDFVSKISAEFNRFIRG